MKFVFYNKDSSNLAGLCTSLLMRLTMSTILYHRQ
jgi:hypothetical protein